MTQKPSTIILFLFISAAPINAVLYAPALPGLTRFLGITKDQAQFTIAIFLLAFAFSQLIAGPMANATGRKKASIIGAITGLAGTLLCILSGLTKSYDLMIGGRFISALGLGMGISLSYTMINDVYTETKARRITGYCVLSFAVTPGIANFVGGILTAHLGWESCFYFLLSYNFVLLLSLLNLSETMPVEKRIQVRLKNIVRGYTAACKNLKVIKLATIYGLKTASLYTVVTLIPFIAIHNLKMTPSTFGTAFFTSYLGYILGTLLATKFVAKFNAIKSVLIGICASITGGIILMCFALLNIINVYTVFASIAIIMSGFPFVFINASMLGIKAHKNDKANASSIFNFISIFLAFLAVTVLGTIKHDTVFLLASCVLLLSLLATTLYIIYYKIHECRKEKSQNKF